jgi:predicted aminopeptidase
MEVYKGMETGNFAKQVIDFNKTTFENTFNAVVMFQDNAEKLSSMIIDQAAWLPKEGRKAIDEWVSAYKNGRDDFKKAIDENFNKIEKLFAKPNSEKKPESPKNASKS